jgi:hypothetical protein
VDVFRDEAIQKWKNSSGNRLLNREDTNLGGVSSQRTFNPAFLVSQSQVSQLILYIQNQELLHRKQSFQSEYLEFLEDYEIDFKPEYLFEPLI